tara:strand:+ start:448 stop:1011 length:564 start_codon:yes stop_codon:yes gene_type:complete
MPKQKIEIVEKNIEDTDNSNQIVEQKTDDNSIQKAKPKRVQSQKQKDAFAKLVAKNKERFEAKQKLVKEVETPIVQPTPAKQKKEKKVVAPVVEDNDSSSEEAPAPVVVKKKKKKKQKIIIEDDSSSSDNEIIIRRSKGRKKKPIVEDKEIEKSKPIDIPQETHKEPVEEPIAKKYTHNELLKAFGL